MNIFYAGTQFECMRWNNIHKLHQQNVNIRLNVIQFRSLKVEQRTTSTTRTAEQLVFDGVRNH